MDCTDSELYRTEIWGFMPGERESSVFLAEWYPLQRLLTDDDQSSRTGQRYLQAKEAINKVIEEQRNQGVVKGSLGADISCLLRQNCINHWPSWVMSCALSPLRRKRLCRHLSQASELCDSMLEGLKVPAAQSTARNVCAAGTLLMMWVANAEHPKSVRAA